VLLVPEVADFVVADGPFASELLLMVPEELISVGVEWGAMVLLIMSIRKV
jgi:hypothetical protein